MISHLSVNQYHFPADDMDRCDTIDKVNKLLSTVISMNNIHVADYDDARRFVLLHLCKRGKTDLAVAWILLQGYINLSN